MNFTIDIQGKLIALAAAADRLLGYPRAGVHIGGGRHVDDGSTQTHARVIKHPSRNEHAYEISTELEAALDVSAQRKRLSGAELDDLDSARAGSAPLDPTWLPES